jgi:methylthioribose-1-phosphate isomerase
MQHGLVDLCLVGSDRTTASGDVCNKIGTYLKALSANDNQLPFYVALPASTIDWTIDDGLKHIPIEQRDARELTHITGLDSHGETREVKLVANSPAANYAFDVTPARLISGLITEHGIFQAEKSSLAKLQKQL